MFRKRIVVAPGAPESLSDDLYLPPLHFAPHEAAAIFLGAQMLGVHTVGRLTADAERSLYKLAVALLKPLRAEMERLSEVIRFVASGLHFDLDDPRLTTLQQAIGKQRVVWIHYHAIKGDEVTKRAIEPHELSFDNGALAQPRRWPTWRTFPRGTCRLATW